MSIGKRDRKKLVKILVGIIIFVIVVIFGIEFTNIIPTVGDPSQTEVGNSGSQDSSQAKPDVPNQGNNAKPVEGELLLTMIDVGQADSFLFIQNGKVALVDCGTRSTGKDVVEYLQDLGITKIDYVFGTHPHDDHMGGMYDVITNFEIGKIILPEIKTGEVTTNWYLKLMKEIKDGGYKLELAKVGTTYNLGKATMKVIGQTDDPDGNLNNYSTVLKVSFGEMDVIMTGDAETQVEKEVLASGENIDAEILKMGHHGSDTSSSDEFLDAISPDYALISAKVGNKYAHPIKSTMENLQNRNIDVYRTDESGTVVLTITTDDVSFSCELGDYLSGEELEKEGIKMKSYASVDRIEGKFAVCEVEMVDINDSKTEDYSEKDTQMMDIPLKIISASVTDVQEGDILVVEHNETEVTNVYAKDDEEKQRRIAILKELLGE